jgi:hypothetical protein
VPQFTLGRLFLQARKSGCNQLNAYNRLYNAVARQTTEHAMKLLFLAAILILPAGAANWERWNHSGKGLGIGPADPHPLSYFTRYPSLRDPYFCHNCSPEKRLALAKQEKLKEKQRTEVTLVGTVYGFKVYDVL